jgi:hypothetical protein
VTGTVYLLHFLRPIGDLANPRGQAQHYLGWSRAPERRVNAHREGRGAAIVREVNRLGIGFLVAATWPGTRADERRLKNRKNAPRLCPVCRAEAEPSDDSLAGERLAEELAEVMVERALEDAHFGAEVAS